MQFQKENILKAIMESAEQEFLEKGFRESSLRSISGKSGVTLSNIYNYFKDKNDLYCMIFNPLIKDVQQAMSYMEELERTSEEHHSEGDHLRLLEAPVRYVIRNRERLKCLLFKSEGSSLHRIQDMVIDWFAIIMKSSYDNLKNRHGLTAENPSDDFYRLLGSLWMHSIEDSIKNNLDYEQIMRINQELMRFVYHGWSGMLNINH